MDAFDNLYVADSNDCKIRVVNSTTGIIKTYAGTGMQGSSGDGGQAISALLNQPQAVAVDISRGSVFIADTGNGKIRIVTSDGTITTFAGSGYASSNTYDCAATSAQLVNPASLAVDSVGNVYIGTGNPYGSNNNQVLVVAHGTGFITLFAGTGGSNSYMSPLSYGDPATSTLLYLPTGIAVDSSFNLYIATAIYYSSYNQVLVVTHDTGIITVFAGSNSWSHGDGGLATDAILPYPSGILVDKDNNVYISDQQSNNVRVVAYDTGIISTFAGGSNYRVPGLGDGGPASNAFLSSPSGLVVDRKGTIYIADRYDYRVRKVTSSFNYPTGQPTSRPSIPTSQPTVQPTGEPSKWYPKAEVSVFYAYVMVCLTVYLYL